MADHWKKDQANAQFKKLQRAEDGKKALSEYEAERAAIRTNTKRLKALRLARDAAEQAAPKPAAVTKKKPAKPAKKKKTAGTLSTWLTDQQASGRSS